MIGCANLTCLASISLDGTVWPSYFVLKGARGEDGYGASMRDASLEGSSAHPYAFTKNKEGWQTQETFLEFLEYEWSYTEIASVQCSCMSLVCAGTWRYGEATATRRYSSVPTAIAVE